MADFYIQETAWYIERMYSEIKKDKIFRVLAASTLFLIVLYYLSGGENAPLIIRDLYNIGELLFLIVIVYLILFYALHKRSKLALILSGIIAVIIVVGIFVFSLSLM
jgi:hypothetical protein